MTFVQYTGHLSHLNLAYTTHVFYKCTSLVSESSTARAKSNSVVGFLMGYSDWFLCSMLMAKQMTSFYVGLKTNVRGFISLEDLTLK